MNRLKNSVLKLLQLTNYAPFVSAGLESKGTEIIPYGLGCVIELLRFLVSLCNSYDKQNTEIMTFTSLSLLTVALELGADPMSKHPALLALIKDSMCRNFFSVSLEQIPCWIYWKNSEDFGIKFTNVAKANDFQNNATVHNYDT